jgi:PAS domain S-box-containing protein
LLQSGAQLSGGECSMSESLVPHDFKTLFESSPGLYLVLRTDAPRYTIAGASDAYLRATLTERAAIVGRALFDVFPDNPADPATDTRNMRASLDRAIASSKPDVMAVQRHDIRAASGEFEERHWNPVNSPVFGTDGTPRFVLHSVNDVTEFVLGRRANDRRGDIDAMEAEILRAGHQLQETNRNLRAANQGLTERGELQFRMLFDLMPQLGWTARENGVIDFYNQRWYEYTGATWESLQASGRLSVHDPLHLPAILERWDHSLLTGEPFEMEFPLRRADGVFRWFLTRVRPVRDAEGKIVRWVGINTDIHDQKMASENRDVAEREKAEKLRASLAAIVEASDDAIIGKTLEGVITSWNQGAHRLFGYTAEEMVGKSIYLILPPGRELEEPAILAALARGEVRRFETVRRRKDGRDIDVSVTSSPVRDASGRVVAISKVARDITDRKQAETALALAKDRAESASRELEAFSYSVAHDLRAPLRGMNGFAQVLLSTYKEKFDAEGQDWLEEIVLNAAKMGDLIDGLLSLAQLTRSELKPARVDLSQVVREAAARLAALEPQHAVELVVQAELYAQADLRLARALVQNLLANAWKFTRQVASARIEFGAIAKDGEPAFFVRDNGAGFDMAFAGKLFVPFQRLHTADEFPGTGIGLATVQRIVRRHGGRVWAEGAVGAGATFYFTFSPPALEATT